MYRFLLIGFFFFFLIPWTYSLWWICDYTSKIEECIKANTVWSPGPLAIDDYICIQSWSKEEITYQIVLDREFTKIDDDIWKFLEGLEEAKDYYFWKNAISNFLEGVNDISNKFWKHWFYWIKYKNLCSVKDIDWTVNDESIQSLAFTCLWWSVSTIKSKGSFKASDCMWLAEVKLELYEDVAYDILRLNKHQVRKDEKKLFIQNEREKYDMLVEVFMVNIWYVERIWRKWPSVTPEAK